MTTTSTPASGAGSVVLITGCSSGIGLLAAQRFARAGFQVFASMRDPARGAALREQALAEGWWLRTPALDVTSDESVARAVSGLLADTGGRVDVLVNNAGYFCLGAVDEPSPDELRAQLETTVLGVLRVTRAVPSSGYLSNRARSACLPTSMLPTKRSTPRSRAGSSVMLSRASASVMP